MGIQKRDYARGGIRVKVMFGLFVICEHTASHFSQLNVFVPPIRTARFFPRSIGITSGYGLRGSVSDIKHADTYDHELFEHVSWYRDGGAIC